MHIRATDKEAKKIKAVLLDRRIVPLATVVEVNDEEGWVDSCIPLPPEEMASNGDDMNTVEADWKIVRRTGKVKIIFHKD